MSSLSLSSKILWCIGTAIAVFPAQAEEFSWQLSGVTRHIESGDSASDTWAVDATYYVNPIDDTGGPYALASFLNPTTRVSATANMSDSLLDIFDDSTAYTLGATFVLPGERWYVGADYERTNPDGTTYGWYDQNGYGVAAGRYLGANTTLELGWGRSQWESSFACPPGDPTCFGDPFDTAGRTDSVGIEVFHVRRFRSLTYSLQGSVTESESDFETRDPSLGLGVAHSPPFRLYSVATELFPTQRLGVRVGYSRSDSGFDVDTYDAATTWFFKPHIGVQFSLSHSSIEKNPSVDGAAVRFIGRL